MKAYSDLADLPEDERIGIIGKAAMAGNIVGIALENDDEKIDRYLAKLHERFPNVQHVGTYPGLAPGTVLVQVGPPATN